MAEKRLSAGRIYHDSLDSVFIDFSKFDPKYLSNEVGLGLQEPGATCDDCRWKIERHECPWDYDYDNEHPYAEDCIDFRNINSPESVFKTEVM